ncbi:MAG: hypothetical protein ACYC09_13000 [Bacteroidota bacterium]
MSIPVSKRIIKTVIPNAEKETECCSTKKWIRKGPTIVCGNQECKNAGQPATLRVPEGATPTGYKVRSLSPTEYGRLTDEAFNLKEYVETGKGLRPGKLTTLWVKAGLVGWENFDAQFRTSEQELLDLGKRQMITDEAFNEIPYEDVMDIAEAVRFYNNLQEDQRKN